MDKTLGTTLTKKKQSTEQADWVVAKLTSIGEIGFDVDEVETTTLDSPDGFKEYEGGLKDAGEVPIAGKLKDDKTLDKMITLATSSSVESWEVKFPSGAKWEFDAFVKSIKDTEKTPDGKLGFTGTLRITGKPTFTPATTNTPT